MRCGSASFSSKVPSVQGLHVLWNMLQRSQMSVRDVSLDLPPMLSLSHCSQVPLQQLILTSYGLEWPGLLTTNTGEASPKKITLGNIPVSMDRHSWHLPKSGVIEWQNGQKSEPLASDGLEFTSQFNHSLVMGPWTRSFLFFSALIFFKSKYYWHARRTWPHWVVEIIEWNNIHRALQHSAGIW